ncbi:hypothetical protein Cni_G29283 [Canna indica]|uniref:Uncharacterized protein n=1 Tax=Canna indica TaxID=4628 RepID=A0AAQ3L4H0_9LILI|nr:hypothetical protein Cni_G29283 [Canna indica]
MTTPAIAPLPIPTAARARKASRRRVAEKWKELKTKVDQLPEAMVKAQYFHSRGGEISHETPCNPGQ